MAVGDAKRCIANAAHRVTFPIRLTTGALLTGSLGTTVTQSSSDAGNFAALPAASIAVQIQSSGVWYVDIAKEENVGSTVVIQVTSNTANVIVPVIVLEHEPCMDSGMARASGASTLVLRSAANSTDQHYYLAIVEIVRGTCAGQSRLITAYTGGTQTAAVDRPWLGGPPDTTSVYIIKAAGPADLYSLGGSSNALATMKLLYDSTTRGAVDQVIPTDTTFNCSGLITTNDYYEDSYLLFTSGVLSTLGRPVSSYIGSSQTITVATAFPTEPTNGDTFVLIGNAS